VKAPLGGGAWVEVTELSTVVERPEVVKLVADTEVLAVVAGGLAIVLA
jgi:hypothetical protein